MDTDKVYVVLSRTEAGYESIAAPMGVNGWLPLVTTSDAALPRLTEAAQSLATATGKQLLLVAFSSREVLRELVPNRTDHTMNAQRIGPDLYQLRSDGDGRS